MKVPMLVERYSKSLPARIDVIEAFPRLLVLNMLVCRVGNFPYGARVPESGGKPVAQYLSLVLGRGGPNK